MNSNYFNYPSYSHCNRSLKFHLNILKFLSCWLVVTLERLSSQTPGFFKSETCRLDLVTLRVALLSGDELPEFRVRTAATVRDVKQAVWKGFVGESGAKWAIFFQLQMR